MPTDFYLLDERLTDGERAIRDRLRAFCEHEVTPVINGYWERAEFPVPFVLDGAKKWIGNASFADVTRGEG
jgi:hypothetical protein